MQMLVLHYPYNLVMLQILLVRWIKENCFVTIAREKDTPRVSVLSCMVIHLGGIKGDLS